ncbi:hypothetical protein FOZ76_17290 [Verticiella sediminum]|uniref:Xanthine/uracil/vitamin C permease n=1 Tax=Verticiella sediminum TaxID=1247510 RepID=A0A556AGW0_9BURK|nr:solute carrier family 23 protein [Verticiella sediminum]TSH92127.1 hypothetical protein FOZ76_17290 [Verticiella sediminum]
MASDINSTSLTHTRMHRPAASWLRLPPSPTARRRTPDIIYGAQDRPPTGVLLTLAAQHAATALALLTYVIAAGSMGRLDVGQIQQLVAATALGMALCTALQAWGGRLGCGLLVVHMPNPLLMLLSAEVLIRYGPGGMVGATLVLAVCMFATAYCMPYLRTVFPPAVAGVVICMAGLSLAGSSLSHAIGLGPDGQAVGSMAWVSLVTLGVIVACAIWGARTLKLLGLLAGIAVGVVLSAFAGLLAGWDQLSAVAWLALPTPPAPVFALDPGLVIALALIGVMSQLDTFGTVVLMQKIEDTDWRRADLRATGRAMRANGIGDGLAAWLGAYSTCTSSANIALAHISRSTSRYIGLATAALLALVALMPKASLALSLIPPPVIGAIEVYVAAFLIVAGIELITQRALDSRAIFMVGISLTLGLGVLVLPQVAQDVPPVLQFLVGNGVIVASLVAIALNLLFRLGTGRSATLTLDTADTPHAPASAITDFIERQGAAWGARRDVIVRAAMAALEASEAIAGTGHARRVRALRGAFDEYNLDIDLEHDGPPLAMQPAAAGDLARLLDDEDDVRLEQAVAGASLAMLRHLADRVNAGTRQGRSFIHLHFDH